MSAEETGSTLEKGETCSESNGQRHFTQNTKIRWLWKGERPRLSNSSQTTFRTADSCYNPSVN